MRFIPLIARLLLGLVFFASGLFGLVSAPPPPADLPADMLAFVNGMMASKYFFPLLKGTEMVCGALLLINWYVPLALVILAPIVVNILCVHTFLAPQGFVIAAVIAVLEFYVAFFVSPYKQVLRPLLQKKPKPLV